ncbi:MAG: hypothetical protein CL862_04650 [Cyanobium sp. NAT70]|nr:hypothetical protein [Cyanobium sp. NAT70]
MRSTQLLLSGSLALLATLGFVTAVGAAHNAMLLLLFGGFWLGMHSFLGFVRLSSRLDREARLPLLSAEDYDRAVLNRTGQARRTVVDQEK